MFFLEGWRLLLEFRRPSWRYQRTFIPKYKDNVFYKQNNLIFNFFAFGHKKTGSGPGSGFTKRSDLDYNTVLGVYCNFNNK
jgi:hypothetical protein